MPNQKSNLTLNSAIIKKLWGLPIWRERLLSLLSRILNGVGIKREDIQKLMETKKNDASIFDELVKMNNSPIELYTEEYDTKRTFRKWQFMRNNLTTHIKSLLDMGGNVGNTASVLGHRILKIPKSKIYVVDIENWEGKKWIPRDDITFVDYYKMDTIPDNSIDLITIFHTLHHIPTSEYDNILEQFNRILTKDGCIVLYEHNCSENNWAGIIDIEHALYDVVVSKKKSYKDYIKTYYAKYLSINKWENLFKKYKFNKYFQKELNNTDNSVYIYFQKS